MGDAIKLPPLPPLDFEECSDDTTFACEAGYSPESLRARDLEVVRCVLEAAAELSDAMDYGLGDLSKAIRALEFTHD